MAYVVIRFYLNCKNVEQSNCEWVDLSTLETTIQEKVVKHERQTSLQVGQGFSSMFVLFLTNEISIERVVAK